MFLGGPLVRTPAGSQGGLMGTGPVCRGYSRTLHRLCKLVGYALAPCRTRGVYWGVQSATVSSSATDTSEDLVVANMYTMAHVSYTPKE